MPISIENVSYVHADKEQLFSGISFAVSEGDKIALVGDNGSGKSTLLRIMAGVLQPSSGEVVAAAKPYYIPQHFGQFDDMSVAQALGIADKLKALHAILGGDASADNFTLVDDDWSIEKRALAALSCWGLTDITLSQCVGQLSGGEKTKVFLSSITIHNPEVILLDEPSNHLDISGRELLYNMVETSSATMIVVSHDRTLLNLLNETYELGQSGIKVYGGNYEFYKAQKEEMLSALYGRLDEKEKALRKAKKVMRESIERKSKMDARGKKAAVEKGIPRIMMKTMKDKAEFSSSKLKDTHREKIGGINDDLRSIRKEIPDNRLLKLDFENASLHHGKIVVTADHINFGYGDKFLWEQPVSFQIKSGERIVISGKNGTGKTSLIKIILGMLEPMEGAIARADFHYLYLDQEYSVIDNKLTVMEQAGRFNVQHLPEHEVKTLLNRYLFPLDMWNKSCASLSGGEKIRLLFCCLTVRNKAPDVFVLDEPTNNLDIKSMEIVTAAMKSYNGTILLISHDKYFINEIGIDRYIDL
jgi:ATPase subunit of ABC transporter with duplicated ATPase domains